MCLDAPLPSAQCALTQVRSTPMPALTPAAELARAVSRPFPNEPEGYRAAREALIAEEIELRRHLAAVAEQRRALPIGGEVPTANSRIARSRRECDRVKP